MEEWPAEADTFDSAWTAWFRLGVGANGLGHGDVPGASHKSWCCGGSVGAGGGWGGVTAAKGESPSLSVGDNIYFRVVHTDPSLIGLRSHKNQVAGLTYILFGIVSRGRIGYGKVSPSPSWCRCRGVVCFRASHRVRGRFNKCCSVSLTLPQWEQWLSSLYLRHVWRRDSRLSGVPWGVLVCRDVEFD
eukprot:g76864.t1